MSDNIDDIKAESLKWQKMANELLETLDKCVKQEATWLAALKDKQSKLDETVDENKRLLGLLDRINNVAKRQDDRIAELEGILMELSSDCDCWNATQIREKARIAVGRGEKN